MNSNLNLFLRFFGPTAAAAVVAQQLFSEHANSKKNFQKQNLDLCSPSTCHLTLQTSTTVTTIVITMVGRMDEEE